MPRRLAQTGDLFYVVSAGIVYRAGSMTNSTTNPHGHFAAIPGRRARLLPTRLGQRRRRADDRPAWGEMWAADEGSGTRHQVRRVHLSAGTVRWTNMPPPGSILSSRR